jgi:hypothetical protein
LEGSFGNERVPKWNGLMHAAIRAALKQGQPVSEVKRRSGANVVSGQRTDRGFNPVSGCNASVQSVQSDRAWLIPLSLARWLRLPIKADFHWQDKEGAAFPGQAGSLEWTP